MRSYSFARNGVLIRSYYRPGGISGTEIVGTYPAASRSLTCPVGVIKGDHHKPNPWSFSIRSRAVGSLEAYYTSPAGTDMYSGPYIGATEGLATWLTSDQSSATAQAYERLIEKIRGSTDLSVDAFQLRQTIGTPKQIFNTFVQALYTAGMVQNKKRRSKAQVEKILKRTIRATGESWLIWVYGIKPTLQSIHDMTVFTRNHYMNELKVYEGKSTISRSVDIPVPNWPGNTWQSVNSVKTSARTKYKVVMKIPDNELTSMARLSSLNPASIAWELTPWSFVVDWFFNIGDYLRGLETAMVYGRYFDHGFVTTSFRSEGSQVAWRPPSTDPNVSWGGSYTATGYDQGMNRQVLSSFPAVPAPKLQVNLGSGRLLNAAALLTTFLKR